jgi:gliding motility-associated-like protein
MRKLTLIYALISFVLLSVAQENRYWVNGSGKWQDKSHWALTSGGLGGADIPTEKENVFVDANSGLTVKDVIYIKQLIKTKDFTLSSPVRIKGKRNIIIEGSVKVSDKVQLRKFKGDFVFASSKKQSIDIPVKLNSNIVFNGKNGTWNFESDINTKRDIILEKGTVNTNDKTVKALAFSTIGSKPRGLNLGKSEIIVENWNFAESKNLEFDATKSNIQITNDFQENFKTKGLVYNSIGQSSGKAAPSYTMWATPQDPLCPINAPDPLNPAKRYGSITITFSDAATYYVKLLNGTTGIETQKSGNPVIFNTLEPADYLISSTLNNDYSGPYKFAINTINDRPDEMTATIYLLTHADCYGDPIGLTVTPGGGTLPYDDAIFSWLGGLPPGFSASGKNIVAPNQQIYSATIYDANHCEFTAPDNYTYYLGNGWNDYETGPKIIKVNNLSPKDDCSTPGNTGEIEVKGVTGGTPDITNPNLDVTGYGYYITSTGTPPSGAGDYQKDSIFTGLAVGTYDLYVIDSKGCELSYGSINIGTQNEPIITLSNSSAIICADSDYNFSGNNVNYEDYIEWSTSGTGTFSSISDLNPTYFPSDADTTAGSVILTMEAFGLESCSSATENFTLTMEPVAKANAGGPATICSDETYDFATISSASNAASLAWTTSGDGSFDVPSALEPVYTPGTNDKLGLSPITLTLIAEGNATCDDAVATMILTIEPAPTAYAGINGGVCSDETYVLSGATATNSSSVVWTSTGDGTFDTSTSDVNATYLPGTNDKLGATVTLKITTTGTAPCGVVFSEMDLIISPAPIADAGGPATICSDDTYDFATISSASNAASLAWTTSGDGSFDVPSALEPVYTPGTNDKLGLSPITLTLIAEGNATCDDAISSMDLNIVVKPEPYAGFDTTICSYGSYKVVDAMVNASTTTYSWNTIGGDGIFTPLNTTDVIDPEYTPGTNDLLAGFVDLVLTANNATCGNFSDIARVNIPSELIASVGAPSPFNIANTTDIKVAIWAEHEQIIQLEFYLVAPDGTKTKLYNHFTDAGAPCLPIITQTFDTLVFSSLSSNPLDFCNFEFSPVINGTFDITGDWSDFYGKDPAQGGWAIEVVDNFNNSEGNLNRVQFSFTDVNISTGFSETITYDSKELVPAFPIVDNDTTIYYVPIGLRASCFNTCDAEGVVSVLGGVQPYKNYEWLDDQDNVLLTGATATTFDELCGTVSGKLYRVVVTDSIGCIDTASVYVFAPDTIKFEMDSLNLTCNGDSSGMVEVDLTTLTGGDVDNPASAGNPGDYTFLWEDDGSTDYKRENLPAGEYIVHVFDKTGTCGTIDTATISQPDPITFSLDSVQTACSADIGKVMVSNITGGDGSFTVDWGSSLWAPYPNADVFDKDTIENLGVGEYVAIVSDGNGCSVRDSANVTDTSSFTVGLLEAVEPLCFGDPDGGSIRISGTNGTYPFTYVWDVNDGVQDSVLNDVPAGTYNVTVTDANGCTEIISYDLLQPDLLQFATKDSTATLCYSDSSGTAEVSGLGGTQPYSFYWTNAKTDGDTLPSSGASISGLPYGYVYIELKDANGCQAFDSIFIDQPTKLTAITDSVPTTCSADIGQAIIKVAGGTLDYTYLWVNSSLVEVATADTAKGLSAGIYSVTVTDGNLCTLDTTVTVTDDSDLEVKIDTTNDVLCNGGNNGKIFIDVIGGTANYSYSWKKGGIVVSTDSTASSLTEGYYTIEVTDANGCIASADTTIYEPLLLTVNHIVNNEPTCFGTATGSATVIPIGGVTPYTYLWPSGETSDTDINLSAGDYSVEVTDSNGCVINHTVTLTDPAKIAFDILAKDTYCGDSIGEMWVTNVTNAVGAYTTNWTSTDWTSTGGNYPAADSIGTDTIRNLWVANYVAIVTDIGNGCIARDSMSISDTSNMDITIDSIAQVACAGGNNGAILVSGTNGIEPYSYIWSTSDADSLLQGLSIGTYVVTVTDNQGCMRDSAITITEPPVLTMTKDSTSALCYGSNTGTASVVGFGGTEPYTFVWTTIDNDTISQSAAVTELPFGYVYIELTDFNSCSISDSIFIDQPVALSAVMDSTPTRCGIASGTATLTMTSGVAPFTYLWENSLGENVGTDSIAIDLTVGIYSVIARDFNNCEFIESISIIDTSNMDVVLDNAFDALCNGTNTGSANIVVTGGVEPLTFIWSSGEITPEAVNLPVGTNYVTVTDANSCSRILEFEVGEPDALETISTKLNDPQCPGSYDGSAKVSTIGGVKPYTFSWSNGESDSIATNLNAGEHYVTVIDANGCSTIDSITLVDPTPITYDTDFTNTNCAAKVGLASITNIAGGTGSYEVSWAHFFWDNYPSVDSIKTETIENLGAGIYEYIITDANKCSTSGEINVGSVSDLSLVIDSINDVSCNGGSDAAIFAHGEGGTPPYNLIITSLSGDEYIDSVTNTSAGMYNVRVLDANLCEEHLHEYINQPSEIRNEFVATKGLICAGDTTANVYADVTGGTKPYSFIWVDSKGEVISTDSNIVDATAGKYLLNIIDGNNCNLNDSIVIEEPTPIMLSTTQGITTCPDSLAWAKVTATGGVAPYTFNWYQASNPSQILEGQATDSASKLWVDRFVIQVTDSLGCVAYDTVLIEDDSGLDFNIEVINHVTCLSKCDASAEIKAVFNPSGPVSTYTVEWGTGGETTPIASALCLGSTPVYVSDAFGCKVVKEVTITNEDALKTTISRFNDISQGDDACNGSAKANPTGGVEPYFFAWTAEGSGEIIGTNAEINNRCEGWYYVTITDASPTPSCELLDSVYIEDDPLRYDTLLLQHVLCHGDSTGQVTLAAKGGFPGGYNYQWANKNWSSYPVADSTRATIENLVAGRYYFTITDNSTSEIFDSIDVTQPDIFIPHFAITETNCYDSSGVIMAIENGLTGGTPPFAYAWANDNWSSFPVPDSVGISISNLHLGLYTVFISDGNGCQVTSTTLEMKDNSDFNINPASEAEIRCYGLAGGIVYANPSNESEIAPIDFTWDDGQKTDTIYNLKADTYYVTAVDGEGCIRENAITLTQPDIISFTLKDTVMNECYDDSDGQVTVTEVKGGNSGDDLIWTYTLKENSVTVQEGSDSVFNELSVGKYEIQVVDGKGCPSETEPFTFLSFLPQVIKNNFNIVSLADCNYEGKGGELEIDFSYGFFDQVTSTTNTNVQSEEIRWDDTVYTKVLTNTDAGIHYVDIIIQGGLDKRCTTRFDTVMPAQNYVYIQDAYVIESALGEDYFCPSDTVQLYVDAPEVDSVVWSNQQYIVGSPNSAIVDVVSRTSKAFIPTAYINGCRDIDTVTVGRYSIDSLIAEIVENEDQIFVGNEIILRANEPNVSNLDAGLFNVHHNFNWIPNNNEIIWDSRPDSIEATVKPQINTLFTVYDTIQIISSDYSSPLCALKDTVSIIVLPEFDPPKGFSPNGDGPGDTWELPGIEGYDKVFLQIFNRWGGLVWEKPSGDYEPWDGKNMKGKPLPSGTYYYILKYSNEGQSEIVLPGRVSIIR